MNGTKRRRNRNVWEITVERGRDANGKRRRRSCTVHGTKAEADRKQREMVKEAENDMLSGKIAAEAPMLLKDWMTKYLEEVGRLYPTERHHLRAVHQCGQSAHLSDRWGHPAEGSVSTPHSHHGPGTGA